MATLRHKKRPLGVTSSLFEQLEVSPVWASELPAQRDHVYKRVYLHVCRDPVIGKLELRVGVDISPPDPCIEIHFIRQELHFTLNPTMFIWLEQKR